MRKFLLAGLLALPVALCCQGTAQAQRIVFAEEFGGGLRIGPFKIAAINIGPGPMCGMGPIYNYGPFTSTPSWALAGPGGYAGFAGNQTPSSGPPCGPLGCRAAAPPPPPPGGAVLPASYNSPFVPPGYSYRGCWPGTATPGGSFSFGQ